LVAAGVPEATVNQLDLLGFSGIANVLSCIKMAKHYSLGEDDVLLTVLTDSMELYGSRLHEMQAEMGDYTEQHAAADRGRWLLGENTDNMLECNEQDRRRIHNLKYYTWVEQQGRTYEEIQAQWNDADYWTGVQRQGPEIDALVEEFNAKVAG
jgi:hypothetical protein